MNREIPEYISVDFCNSFEYLLCGRLVSEDFCHPSRVLDIPVMIIVQSGVLNILIEERRYTVRENEMIILPPRYRHSGVKSEEGTGKVEYFWVHFNISNKFLFDSPCGTDTRLPLHFELANPSRVRILCTQLMDVSQTVPTDIRYCSFLLDALVCEISCQAKNTLISPSKLVNAAAAWIKLHITERISLDDTAEQFGYNKRYLARVFKEHIGVSVNKFIEGNKIELAKNMLTYSDESIVSIAHQIGYEDAGYFMRVFKKNEGITCSRYRNAYSKMKLNKK